MRKRNSIVWKLNIVVVAIIMLVIVATGLVNNVISNRHAMESAREMLTFNSRSILGGIDKLMMNRDNEGVLDLIQQMSEGSAVYKGISLVSHRTGEVAVSRLYAPGTTLGREDYLCATCHAENTSVRASGSSFDRVVDGPGHTRLLQITTPIPNKASCQTADCHAHANSGPILGFLQAEYSLGGIRTIISGLNTSFMYAALAAILLGSIALWIMFRQILTKPIHSMLSGIQAIAGNDLSFRFKTDRADEFGVVQESFNTMAARIQAHQTELRYAMEYLEGIVENSADIIITVNPEGLIQTINRGAEQALGFQRSELIGERIERLFVDPQERSAAIAMLRDRDNVTNYETRFITKGGEVRNVLLTLSRLRDREGTVLGTFGISKDITKEKDLQNRLLQSEKSAAIGQAVTSIQHAIKNMLNTLTGGSYLARLGMEKNNQERIKDGFGMIEEGISRINSLSLNLLKYAREWKPELAPTDLATLLRGLCGAIKQTAAGRSTNIRCTIAEGMPLVMCDSQMIHMAMMDVATNALDACSLKCYNDPETPEIELTMSFDKDAESVIFAVEDNGIGMTEDTKARIFTPFFTTKEEWGTGLGLAATSHIINLHAGRIEVESEPGKGSTFRIVLPVAHSNDTQGAKNG